MNGLLDTHSFIWCDSDPRKLSPVAAKFIQDRNNTVIVSVASLWEMIIKHNLGKLALAAPLWAIVARQLANGIQALSVSFDHVMALDNLPMLHKDPFDHMLVAQCHVENAVLISSDPVFSQYPVTVLW